MPQTSVFGFDFESPTELPGETLTGGPTGLHPILAQQVENALLAQVNALQTQIDTLENRLSWEAIVSDQTINGPTNFPIEPGKYDIIQMYLRGSLSEELNLGLNINNDVTPDLHRGGYIVWDTATATVDTNNATNALTWAIGQWSDASNNISQLTLTGTNLSNSITLNGTAYRAAAGTGVRHRTEFNGDLAANRLLTALRVTTTTGGGAAISAIRVWIEGHLAV